MKPEHLYTTVSLAIIGGLFYLFFKVISPFLTTITWAVVLSIIFYPLYKVFLKLLKRPWIASLITVIIILILIVGPFTYIIESLVTEIASTYSTVEKKGFEIAAKIQQSPTFSKLSGKISSYTAGRDVDLNKAAVTSLKAVGSYIGERISLLFKNVLVFAINFLIMFLTLFYFLKDGEALTDYIMERLPFAKEQKAQLEKRFKEMIIAVIYGGLAIGIMQGTIGGLTFHFLGLPAPVLWGSAMAVLALVPFIGASLIWGPACIILILQASYAKGVILLIIGVLVISMIDNVLRPMLIGDRTRLHMLLVFFSVFGGIKFFGFIGFILGPLIAALCLSLLEIYKPAEPVAQPETGGQ
ncbi:MAG TPA: AI-2E family transporter [Nitrospirae bacterium]|nr:putative inner membrane protein [bacterium BMS3Abin10]GBE39389.1 putative inner membrane protein [bacterium BMS3Bbin08]HDH50962.1 AI-2E family transporter [Nitrospirota bacterium]HDK16985.1 AI-2E family transporter [Nitrospirota bacterium]HDK81175.1 AI-2E family transporter [Nitrospirota bacterium]